MYNITDEGTKMRLNGMLIHAEVIKDLLKEAEDSPAKEKLMGRLQYVESKILELLYKGDIHSRMKEGEEELKKDAVWIKTSTNERTLARRARFVEEGIKEKQLPWVVSRRPSINVHGYDYTFTWTPMRSWAYPLGNEPIHPQHVTYEYVECVPALALHNQPIIKTADQLVLNAAQYFGWTEIAERLGS
jgi:hypothetical protein